jgi:hypothetical protein
MDSREEKLVAYFASMALSLDWLCMSSICL